MGHCTSAWYSEVVSLFHRQENIESFETKYNAEHSVKSGGSCKHLETWITIKK